MAFLSYNVAAAVRGASVPLPVRRHAVLSQVAFVLSVWRERRALARLEADRLADIGIEPAAAEREASRPFWDLPAAR